MSNTGAQNVPADSASEPTPYADTVPADLLRRALRNHDKIAAALRSGVGGPRLFKAIDDMRALKGEAAELGCYPKPDAILRSPTGVTVRTADDSFPWEAPAWRLVFAFCGQCWERRRLWAKGNVGYCKVCRPDWGPGTQDDGEDGA